MLFYDDDTNMLFLAMKVFSYIIDHLISHVIHLLFFRVNQLSLSLSLWTNLLTSVKVCCLLHIALILLLYLF